MEYKPLDYIEALAGKTISHVVDAGYSEIYLFTADGYAVLLSSSDGDISIKGVNSHYIQACLSLDQQVQIGLISEKEKDEKQAAKRAKIEQSQRESRRKMYEQLRSEFEQEQGDLF